MSRLHRVSLAAHAELVEIPGSRWVFVESGAALVDAPGVHERVGAGDAVLVDARTPHRIHAVTDSVLSVADLRTPSRGVLPSPLVVRCFAARHPGLVGLVGSCPQRAPEVGSAHFTESYGNLIAAAMTASWEEDRGTPDPASDPVVDTVVTALRERPEHTWTVERMAALVSLSRSALGERFRRTHRRGPTEVLRDIRMQQARRLLESDLTVEAVAVRVGYGSAAAFTRAFTTHHGAPPQTWRRRRQARAGARTTPNPTPATPATTAPTTRTVVTP